MGMFHPHPCPSLIHLCINLTYESSPIHTIPTLGIKIHNSGTFPHFSSLHLTLHTSRQRVSPLSWLQPLTYLGTFIGCLLPAAIQPLNASPLVPDQHQRSFYTLRAQFKDGILDKLSNQRGQPQMS